jgi:preprotein translocase subunit Sec61beta
MLIRWWDEIDENLKIRIKAFLVITIGLPLTLYLISKGIFWLMNNTDKIPNYVLPFIAGFLWFFFWGSLIFKRH